jgi:hypothetical protein
VSLSDRPPYVTQWGTALQPELLQALGHLAVVTSEVEELLHKIYWKHAGLSEESGPIATDNLNPKRLSEDILKFVGLDKRKANILADLKVLLDEFTTINTKRNRCLHWIWEKVEDHREPTGMAAIDLFAQPSVSYQVKRPIYRQSGIKTEPFSIQDIKTLCDEGTWLARRLHGHAIDEESLRNKRAEIDSYGTIIGPHSRSFADIFWPAPWLDKPLPPDTKPLDDQK